MIELEEKLKAMEGGESALTASSGLGIITSTLYAILEKGDHLLCSKGLFFHSNILMNDFLAKMCIDVSFADFKDLNDVQQKIQSNTKAFFIETPTNPKLGVVDIQAVAEIAKSNDCIFIVDSTFAPPPIQRPLSLGADLVVHSLTKYINGHGDALGGGVIGRKDLVDKIKYPSMPCFTGACLSPFNAWLIMRGMATLDMRVRKHCENALEIAKFLQTSPYVEKVIYPALPGYEGYELCQKQMNGMGGGIVSFWLKMCIRDSTMGTETYSDDVIIVADSYDTTDHNQDGYGVYPAERFYYNWTMYDFFEDYGVDERDMLFCVLK